MTVYVLLLIFTLVGEAASPSAVLYTDPETNLPATFASLKDCQAQAQAARSAAANPMDPETGTRAIRTHACEKVSN